MDGVCDCVAVGNRGDLKEGEKMNKRAKKKADKRRRAVIHGIIDEVLNINGLEPRNREETGNKPTVFLDFSGHVAWITVRIHSNGWESYEPEDINIQAYMNWQDDLKDMLCALKKARAAATATGNKVINTQTYYDGKSKENQ